MSSIASDTAPDLPTFRAEQFALSSPPECDMVMKGGVTSGIVYPYATLQIATKYRLHSLGGTSAGAIAAAFAAAASRIATAGTGASGFASTSGQR